MFNHPAIPPEAALLVAGYVAAAAVIDYRERRIPNYLTVPTAVIGLLYSAMPGWIGPVSSILGLLLGFALLLLPWILGGGGMGDVKLLAALGAWLGPVYVLVAFAGGAVLAAFIAIAVITYAALGGGLSDAKARYLATAGGIATAEQPRKAKRVIPFAVPMALSTCLLLAWLWLRQVQG